MHCQSWAAMEGAAADEHQWAWLTGLIFRPASPPGAWPNQTTLRVRSSLCSYLIGAPPFCINELFDKGIINFVESLIKYGWIFVFHIKFWWLFCLSGLLICDTGIGLKFVFVSCYCAYLIIRLIFPNSFWKKIGQTNQVN